jgi:signal transduction histidine kinase
MRVVVDEGEQAHGSGGSTLLAMDRVVRAGAAGAAVVIADTALAVAQHAWPPLWAAPAYAAVAGSLALLLPRRPLAAFLGMLVLAVVTGGGFVLLLWTGYHAGRAVRSRIDTAIVAGAILGELAIQAVIAPGSVAPAVSTVAVFTVLPSLAGGYMAQHDRLVATLELHNQQLRRQSALTAEQERLRERLRIARDMHDSLGHRLSLVTVQAAALEVSNPDAGQRTALGQLAASARTAMDELYNLVAALRGADDGTAPGLDAIDALVRDFGTASVPVTLRRAGQAGPVPPDVGHAAYRVVEEGLTNAVKHAPGRPVAVSLEWEPDALLVTLVNPAAQPANGTGHGLAGLTERVGATGGFLDHRCDGGVFRLVAVLPLTPAPDPVPPARGQLRTVLIGAVTAVLMFVLLPASMLLGIR